MHLEASYKASITPEPVKTIMPMTEAVSCQIPPACAGMRLDQALVELLPTYSRSRLQQWLKTGDLRVNGQIRRPRDPVVGGEMVCGEWLLAVETEAIAQDIPLVLCYEDADLLVINKPAGLVVHPAAGNRVLDLQVNTAGTLRITEDEKSVRFFQCMRAPASSSSLEG